MSNFGLIFPLNRWLVTLIISLWMNPGVYAQRFNTDALVDDLLIRSYNGKNAYELITLQATVQLNQINDVCQLTDQQEAKLRDAIQGDVARYTQQIELVRYRSRNLVDNGDLMSQQREVMRLAAPLRVRLSRGVLEEETSLFKRTAEQILTEQQRLVWLTHLEQRQKQRDSASIKLAIAEVERHVLLTSLQRQWLLDTLEKKQANPDPMQPQVPIGFLKLQLLTAEELATHFTPEEIEKVRSARAPLLRGQP